MAIQMKLFEEMLDSFTGELQKDGPCEDPEVDESEKFKFHRELSKTPKVPGVVYDKLPPRLQKACRKLRNNRERDVFLTGALVTLSGAFSSVYGCYDGKKVYPPLYCFIVAPPASDKNALVFSKMIGEKIHNQYMEQFRVKMSEFNEARKKRKKDSEEPQPARPAPKLFYIPGNSSSASVIAHLAQSGGTGVIIETEADTMANTFKQDWGGYSDIARKSFHHETISLSRKTENEYYEVQEPRLGIALSGTPSQVPGIIKSAQDGLFSRFIFYAFSNERKWRDVSANRDFSLVNEFKDFGAVIAQIHNIAEKFEYEFRLSGEQWQLLNTVFARFLKQADRISGKETPSSVVRLGLISYRIAMVLSVLRCFTDDLPCDIINCSDDDFMCAIQLSMVYFQHSMFMFEAIQNGAEEKPSNLPLYRFLGHVSGGKVYKRQELQLIGKSLGFSEKSIDNYLRRLLNENVLVKVRYGEYLKP